ncbi:MAG: GIY-YIG nuclease family protein [Rhodothermales bacterium]|nr:GIY-YIG nuclease family protein [Rhodothermales bacterium]
MVRPCFIYIATNYTKSVLYTGVTNSLSRRGNEHQSGKGSEFTSRYQVKYLLYYESYDDCYDAICREKEIKGWVRMKKLDLIRSLNPEFKFIDWDTGVIVPGEQ